MTSLLVPPGFVCTTNTSSRLHNDNVSKSCLLPLLITTGNQSSFELQDYTHHGPLLFPFYVRLLMTFFGAVILLAGICGNIMVPVVVWTNKGMRSSTNMFLVNLSMADLLVLIICIPTVLIEVHTKPETWMLGQVLCKMIPFMEFATAHVSVLTIIAISLERYYAICYPLEAGYTCTKGRAVAIIISTWLTSAILTSPVILITNFFYADYIDNSVVPVCAMQVHAFWRKFFFLCTTVVFFLIPLGLLIILYAVICKHLMNEKPFQEDGNKHTKCDKNSINYTLKCRQQVVLMLIVVVMCFFICLFPLRSFHLWIIIVPLEEIQALGSSAYYNLLFTCRILTYLNSAINPIIYNVISSKFRDAFCRHLGLKPTTTKMINRCSNFETRTLTLQKSVSCTASTNFTNSTVALDGVEFDAELFKRTAIQTDRAVMCQKLSSSLSSL
ncbi:Ethr (predicted) [Pycnogonum litorale]